MVPFLQGGSNLTVGYSKRTCKKKEEETRGKQDNPKGFHGKTTETEQWHPSGNLEETAIFHPVDSRVCESYTTATSLQNQFLSVNIKTIEKLHGASIPQDLRDLRTRRNELQHIAVILDRPRLVLGSMTHLQGVLQDGDELLNLAVVQEMSRDAACSSQSFQEVYPFSPLAVRGDLDGSLVLFDRNTELVLCDEVIGTLGQTVVDLVEDSVLLAGIEVSRELGKLFILGCDGLWRRWLQELMWAIKFIPVGCPSLGMVVWASSGSLGSSLVIPFHDILRAFRGVHGSKVPP